MRQSFLRILLLAVPMASAFAQAPALQMNVVYVCTDGQSFKVFSCDNTTGACDYQNYKKGQAFQRGEALRVQLTALLPAKCHAQTPAEAQADPHRGELPPAPSPFKARAAAAPAANQAANQSGPGPGGFKVGDTVRVLIDGWQEGTVIEVHGRSYVVRLPSGVNALKNVAVRNTPARKTHGGGSCGGTIRSPRSRASAGERQVDGGRDPWAE